MILAKLELFVSSQYLSQTALYQVASMGVQEHLHIRPHILIIRTASDLGDLPNRVFIGSQIGI